MWRSGLFLGLFSACDRARRGQQRLGAIEMFHACSSFVRSMFDGCSSFVRALFGVCLPGSFVFRGCSYSSECHWLCQCLLVADRKATDMLWGGLLTVPLPGPKVSSIRRHWRPAVDTVGGSGDPPTTMPSDQHPLASRTCHATIRPTKKPARTRSSLLCRCGATGRPPVHRTESARALFDTDRHVI